jgi:8-oxo-dGTP pyrophosphatase MutT (NUDIX family)|tara:strand:- start:2186 stop:2728 length:543 start_codon:yes stop_codon:yes gene_type:complete
MHRSALIDLLRDYARRHPEEAAVTSRFLAFVDAHERCFERDLWAGHVTGSAWLLDRARERVLLTHHRKLGRWLQLGGHSDGDPEPLRVAVREAEEESGLAVQPLSGRIFDLDIHEIPARRQDPAHFHFDVRFALQVADSEDFAVSAESLDLAWVPVTDLHRYTDEASMLRMARKWLSDPL